jgi:hypothetical protein
MKICGTVLALALGAAVQAVAAPPVPEHPSAANTTETNAIPSKLMSLQPAAKGRVEIRRVGKMSSRPWGEVVGWHPGTSQFPDGRNQQPQLTLISFSFGPGTRHAPATSARTTQP